MAAENLELPFNGQLSPNNCWVVMASLISWEKYEVDILPTLRMARQRGIPKPRGSGLSAS